MLHFQLESNLKSPVNQNGILALSMTGALTRDVDGFTSGQLSKAILAAGLQDKAGSFLEIVAPSGTKWHAILIYGTGQKTDDKKNKKSSEQLAMELGGQVFSHATALAKKLLGDDKKKKLPMFWVVDKATQPLDNLGSFLLGYRLKQWQFHRYLTDEKKIAQHPFENESAVYEGGLGDKQALAALEEKINAIYDGVILTRELVSEPANVLTPPEFARRAATLSKDGLKITTLGESAMEKLQMHSLLAVGHGSSQESQLVVMEWSGGEKNAAPICFVGKGVCFDTGGISLKPSGGMEEMIWDMGGAGTVTGLMKLLAMRKAPVNAIGVLAIVENMPDGAAQRPGDIVKSMSGQTIEVLNTDAEGRMILADALWYAQENFKPSTIIDLATLTGAMIVALGHDRAGLFSNDDDLARELFEAGEAVDEKLWQMPLSPIGGYYDKLIDCFEKRADVKNIGAAGQAGSITAAQFLQRFIMARDDYKPAWAHLDIAGMAWHKTASPLHHPGATGYGVRLLNNWISKKFG
ncbi:MAG: leucyl aminopeptidase [Hydrotalea sp.]|nr:leucyl aminopeptidase [Hydrotalea sp.]